MMGLLDTGASMNVLPYEIGLQLGAVWDEQTFVISLSGNLENIEASTVRRKYTDDICGRIT